MCPTYCRHIYSWETNAHENPYRDIRNNFLLPSFSLKGTSVYALTNALHSLQTHYHFVQPLNVAPGSLCEPNIDSVLLWIKALIESHSLHLTSIWTRPNMFVFVVLLIVYPCLPTKPCGHSMCSESIHPMCNCLQSNVLFLEDVVSQ